MTAPPDSVWVDVSGPDGDRLSGRLRVQRARGVPVFSFEYTPAWLAGSRSFAIDPSLPPVPGVVARPSLAGIFADSAPDRWGRLLLDRREQITARGEGRRPRTLGDWDYLLGVQDETRMGGLRFRANGAHLAQEALPVPHLARLSEMEALAGRVEEGEPPRASELQRWLAMLLLPGSSLGGARPKATFLARDGSLWLAKFPSRTDRRDIGRWELLANRLAAGAGVAVPEHRALRLGGGFSTFTARRFDRVRGSRRLYASAMTLTGRSDMEPASYLDVAAGMERHGDAGALADDLGQLFRRLVFNIMIGHRDDHLRNHGFLHDVAGWRPAPAFDLNPMPELALHALAIDERSQAPHLETARATAPLYRLSTSEADAVIGEVAGAVRGWRAVARSLGLPRAEIDLMEPAFAVADQG
jgi:serine/threonine-protein kinase HipA